MSDTPICNCDQFWPEGHHPECPVLRAFTELEANLATAEKYVDKLEHVNCELTGKLAAAEKRIKELEKGAREYIDDMNSIAQSAIDAATDKP